MIRTRPPSQVPTSATVNLYCSQCETQIGIFKNEWIRLTSSYARSKELGSHFGTETGRRLQTVPKSSVALAAGCQMTEVFCRKCSNMVGQYCKVVADTNQQELLHQYFYKLSRTFLKDGSTNGRVDPVFGFGPATFEGDHERSSSEDMQGRTPARWQNTPLRQSSSTPVTVQAAAAKNRMRTHDKANSTTLHAEVRQTESVEPREMKDLELEGQQAGTGNTQNRRQSARLVEREGRVFEIEGRLRYHEGRLIDQENFLNDQSAHIHEQDIVIEEQKARIEEQQLQMQQVNDQLATLQRTMGELRDALNTIQSRHLPQPQQLMTSGELAGHLEMLAGAMRSVGSSADEMQQLRAENQRLRNRLTSVPDHTDSLTGEELELNATSEHSVASAHTLGKRKRNEDQTHQMLTPQSDRSAQPSPTDQTALLVAKHLSRPSAVFEITESGDQTVSLPPQAKKPRSQPQQQLSSRKSVRYSANNTEIPPHDLRDAEPLDTEATTHDFQQLPGPVSMQQESVPTDMNAAPNHDTLQETQATSAIPTNDAPTESLSMPVLTGDAMHIDLVAEQNEPLLTKPGANETQSAGQNQATYSGGLAMGFIQDPTAFDDLGFSDEDGDDDVDQMFGIDNVEADEGLEDADIDVVRQSRDDRSLAPEPLLKPKVPANRKRSYITLDRAHIATPYVFWHAIANGRQPKALKPPAIQTRKKDLEDELHALGLSHWINKDKKCKEYRQAVSAARNNVREAKKAALLSSKGLVPRAVSSPTPLALMEALDTAQTEAEVVSNDHLDGQATADVENAIAMPPDDVPEATAEIPIDPSLSVPARRTRRATRNSIVNPLVPTEESKPLPEQLEEVTDVRPAGRRKSAGPPRSQRKKTAVSNAAQEDEPHQETGTKKSRGRPRKSAPAVMVAPSIEATVVDSDTVVIDPESTSVVNALSMEQAATESSPTPLSASKQALLENMRRKALQKEQMRDEIIKARDKLAEEAMAAMEMEEMMA